MTVMQPKGFHPFHKPKGASYMVEDSFRGIALAASLGKKHIDLDVNFTVDLIPIIGHWDDPAKDHFIIPKWMKVKYNNRVRISNCKWADLQKLRTKPLKFNGRTHIYRYRSVREAAVLCKEKGIHPAWEIKGRPNSEIVDVYRRMLSDMHYAKLDLDNVYWMTLQNIGDPLARLKAMTEAGVSKNRVLLARGSRGIPVSWEPYIDYVRGNWVKDSTR